MFAARLPCGDAGRTSPPSLGSLSERLSTGRSAPRRGVFHKPCDFGELSTVKHLDSKREKLGQTPRFLTESFGQTPRHSSSTDQVVSTDKYVQAVGLCIYRADNDFKNSQRRAENVGRTVDSTDIQHKNLAFMPNYGGGCLPHHNLRRPRIASAAQARQRLRRPPLRSGPPGDPPGPLRLRQHLGPEGHLPARQDGPETS